MDVSTELRNAYNRVRKRKFWLEQPKPSTFTRVTREDKLNLQRSKVEKVGRLYKKREPGFVAKLLGLLLQFGPGPLPNRNKPSKGGYDPYNTRKAKRYPKRLWN